MRILHVITRLILGGAQQNTVLCAAGQVEAGHDVHLAYGPIHGPEGSMLDDALASGATLHELSAMRRAVRPGSDVRVVRQLRRLIRELRPDVVHTHSSKAGIVGRIAAWRERVPGVIHTVHGLPFHDRQPWPVHRLYVALERHAAKRCHGLIAITPQMVDAFEAARIAPRQRFAVVPSGVELERFAMDAARRETLRRSTRSRYGIPADTPVLGVVARLDPLKGHADLLEAYDDMAAAAPGLRLLFVGDGFHRGVLERHPRVRDGSAVLTGLVPLAEVPAHLAAMDAQVLPSYQEGQSRTLVESLAAGVPIAGYAAGGIPAVCVDAVTGLLAPVGDRAALTGQCVRLLTDREVAERLLAAGRAHVAEHFSAGAMVAQTQAVYDAVLGG